MANRPTKADAGRFRQLRDALKSTTPLGRWPPFVVSPSTRELFELANWDAAAARVDVVQVWPVDAVVMNLAFQAACSYADATVNPTERSKRGSSKPLHLTTLDELREWADQTKKLAERVPFSGPLRGQMRAAVTTFEKLIDWPRRYFVTMPPSVDTKADAEFRVNLNLWALEQVRLALPGTAPTQFWPGMFDWLEKAGLTAPPFVDYHEAQKRISRLEQNRLATQSPAPLMADILREVLALGAFGPDGQPRSSPSVH